MVSSYTELILLDYVVLTGSTSVMVSFIKNKIKYKFLHNAVSLFSSSPDMIALTLINEQQMNVEY